MSYMKHGTIIMSLFALAACSEKSNVDSTKFKIDIPITGDGSPGLFYKLTQQKVQQLKIDTLQKGYDSLQIRIWYDYALLDLKKLLIIKRTNSVWSATIYVMTADWNVNNLTDSIKTTTIKTLSPKNGWNGFLDKLFDLKIMSLPNMDDIPGLRDDWTDGITYNIEVATKLQYRFYSYHLPDKFANNYWQAKKMTDILKLAEEELGIGSGIHESSSQ